MTPAAQVVVVGSFNVDHAWHCATLPRAGETLSGRYRCGPGGKGFNQAVAAARAGAATAFVCALGDDAGAAMARGLAGADGIALVADAGDQPTGSAGIHVDDAGRNCIVVAAGANAALSPRFVEAQRGLVAAAAVVLAQLESPAAAVGTALAMARAAGATTVLNPAPADAATSAALLAASAVLTPNETEFAALLARHGAGAVGADGVAGLDDATLHALCRALLPDGSVVVTLGAAGAFVSHPATAMRGDADGCYRVAAERVAAIDTTGAGDAFNGALVASMALAADASFARHVRFACRFAALSTTREGAAEAMPRLDAAAFSD